jgi:SSS family transporter
MQALDWVVIAAYAALLLGIGYVAGRGAKSGEGHLRGERSLPAWAVVFSVLATEVSAATYVGVPERGFRGDWTYLSIAVGSLCGKILLATFFVRLYWRLNLVTVYGFLRERIGPKTYGSSAFLFLVGRLIASGVRMYIAAEAFCVVTGFDLPAAIVLMGVVSTVYTLLGGLKAVVWTDVAQGSLFFLGAAATVAFGLWKLGEPVGDVFARAFEAGKLKVATLEGDWFASSRPLPAAIVAGLFLNLASHGTDQENVQHLLNVRSEKGSARSVIWSGLFTFPVVAMFLAVGTVLWAYHARFVPTAYDPADTKRIFPNFIMHVLPAGLRGLVFAGLFAAAISSLAATLNATTAAWSSDLVRRPGLDARASLARTRRLMAGFGVALTLVAGFFAWYARRPGSAKDLIDLALSASAVVYGGQLGCFTAALVLKRRGGDVSTAAGLFTGFVAGLGFFFQRELFGLERTVIDFGWALPICAALSFTVALCGRRDPARAAALGGAAS